MVTRQEELERALKDLAEARRLTETAERKLGQLTQPGGPVQLVHPDWQWAEDLLHARSPKLLAIPGVIGCGLGFCQRHGVDTGQPCIAVYVRRKLAEAELSGQGIPPLPRSVRSGHHRLRIDVIEMGDLKRSLAPGDSIGPTTQARQGTLGVLATDLDHGDTVALTAMHVTGDLREFNEGDFPTPSFCSPALPGGGSVFGTLRQGTLQGIDAAKLALLLGQDFQPALPPPIGPVQGWRPTAFPGDRGTPVRLFGAVSGFQSGFIVTPSVPLPDDNLDAAITVNIQTADGDSGCALVDASGQVLGFLVGEGTSTLSRLRVFTPASLVLARLRCDIPG